VHPPGRRGARITDRAARRRRAQSEIPRSRRSAARPGLHAAIGGAAVVDRVGRRCRSARGVDGKGIAAMRVTAAAIVAAHRRGETSPLATVADCYARIRAHGDPAIFISLRAEAEALARAEKLAAEANTDLPLYGVPVAIKDNIDVEGLPTTAGCPAFAYEPERDATCVARLERAGAIVVRQTHLDQLP